MGQRGGMGGVRWDVEVGWVRLGGIERCDG